MNERKKWKYRFRPEPDSQAKGAALKKLRTDAGITLRELAKVSGYADSYLCYVEQGKRNVTPQLEAIYELSVPIARAKSIAARYRKCIARLDAA